MAAKRAWAVIVALLAVALGVGVSAGWFGGAARSDGGARAEVGVASGGTGAAGGARGTGAAGAESAADVRLSGVGASFPAPLYNRWVVEFERVRPDIRVNYAGTGSGAGVRAIADGTVAFAASDAPLSRKQLEDLGGASAVLQVPMTAGGVVPAYNVPGLSAPLNFTGPVIADMFMGRITKWNDPRIAALNPGVALPNLTVTPAYRSDGSGTTFVFTSYLAGVSEAFRSTVGAGLAVRFPVGQGGRGNPGVAQIVQQVAGALGYIELNYAVENKIAYGAVQSRDGAMVLPTPGSIASAAESAADAMRDNLTVNLWDRPGAGVYPISAFSYIVVYRDLRSVGSLEGARSLVTFLRWAVREGQGLAEQLHYAPLSQAVQDRVTEALGQLTYKGASLAAQ